MELTDPQQCLQDIQLCGIGLSHSGTDTHLWCCAPPLVLLDFTTVWQAFAACVYLEKWFNVCRCYPQSAWAVGPDGGSSEGVVLGGAA